jgi:DnaJ-domain-containing protein 1
MNTIKMLPKTKEEGLPYDLKTIEQRIKEYKAKIGCSIFEIGRYLKHVKENDLVHGQWEQWLRSIDIAPQTARKMIQAYEQFGNRSMSSGLSTSKIFELLSLPRDIDRQEFVEKLHVIPSTGELKTVDEMTIKEIREVVRTERKRAGMFKSRFKKFKQTANEFDYLGKIQEEIIRRRLGQTGFMKTKSVKNRLITYYEILGVREDADKNEIKRRYRHLIKLIHPDKGGDEHLFKLIHEAYEALILQSD